MHHRRALLLCSSAGNHNSSEISRSGVPQHAKQPIEPAAKKNIPAKCQTLNPLSEVRLVCLFHKHQGDGHWHRQTQLCGLGIYCTWLASTIQISTTAPMTAYDQSLTTAESNPAPKVASVRPISNISTAPCPKIQRSPIRVSIPFLQVKPSRACTCILIPLQDTRIPPPPQTSACT